ncbi:MAG: GNAT family N-acetyltransferase [Alphaproteobacteria bacterium]
MSAAAPDLPTIEIVVTYMSMAAPPAGPARPAPPGKLALLRAEQPSVGFYRFLYNEVGEAWQWTDRRLMPDDELSAVIRDPAVEIYVLYAGGVPSGYAELDFRAMPVADLAYFGLMPAFIGRGLGTWLLDWAVRALWRKGPREVTVNSCNLDHPRALQNYQRVGFVPLRRETKRLVPLEAVKAIGL